MLSKRNQQKELEEKKQGNEIRPFRKSLHLLMQAAKSSADKLYYKWSFATWTLFAHGILNRQSLAWQSIEVYRYYLVLDITDNV